MHRSRRTTWLTILAAATGAVAALATLPAFAAGSKAVPALGTARVGEPAFEFIGRDDQPDLNHAVFYGYVTHLAGVPDAALFSSASRSEATARITFRVDLLLDAHLVLQPLFVTTGTGTLTFYSRPTPAATFGNPGSFARGTAIATASARFRDIVNAQSESQGIEGSVGTVIQRTAGAFQLAGKRYQFGRAGLRMRVSAAGEGMRQTSPTVTRTIIASGDAVVIG